MFDALFSPLHHTPLTFSLKESIFALGVYFLSIAYAVLSGKTSHSLAHKSLNLINLISVIIYSVVSPFFFELDHSLLLSIFVLFSFHHLFFMNFFGVVRRSFSLNLLVALQDSKAHNTTVENSYADGKGLEFIREVRSSAMLREGLVEEINSNIVLTKKGRFLATTRDLLLKIWNLSSSQEKGVE